MIRGGLGQPAQQRSRLRRRRRRRRGVDRLTRRAGHPAHDGGGLAEGRIHAVRRTLLALHLHLQVWDSSASPKEPPS
jgi:hypothetical protein